MLRTPKGWTGPREVDGVPVEGTYRAHQVPLSGVRENPEHLAMLEAWLRSYRPEELFDAGGRPSPSSPSSLPHGDEADGRAPHANGGCAQPSRWRSRDLEALRESPVERPGHRESREHAAAR